MIRRFFDWLLRNYECCAECDEWLATEPTLDWVRHEEEDGPAVLYHPGAMKGQRPRYDGDGAVV